ncbi:hypothetical protein, partial [Microvirga lenta]|uniref:hypothetical protein n=1 Tax=Microvirga lenta TaxID=2881337 RepID=UPI001CFF9605
AAFLVRLPVTSTTGETPLGQWSKQIFGSSPLAFGIGKINVFNTQDLTNHRRELVLYHGAAFKALDKQAAPTPAPNLNWSRLSDSQRYWIVAQKRRMVRMNVGCDREFFVQIAGQLPIGSNLDPASDLESIVYQVSYVGLPSADQLNAYEVNATQKAPLCRARINARTGAVDEFVFLQDGLDHALIEKGYKPILISKGAEAALSYPCRRDASFINTIIDANATLQPGTANIEAVRTGRHLLKDRYGRFQIDCLFETLKLTERWPSIIDHALISPTKSNCTAGITLLAALRKIAVRKTTTRRIQESHDRAVEALNRGDLSSCLRASLEGRGHYWKYILKPTQGNSLPAQNVSSSKDGAAPAQIKPVPNAAAL